MSDKEERLYIVRYPSRLIPEATGITVTRKKFNSKSFTRAEAVEIMAKEIFKAEICEGSGFNVKPNDFDPKDWHEKWANLRTDKKEFTTQ